MSYESQIEFLKEYNTWLTEQKAKGIDLSPEAFMLDRAKEQALGKLIKIHDAMEVFYETPWTTTEEYERECTLLHDKINDILDE